MSDLTTWHIVLIVLGALVFFGLRRRYARRRMIENAWRREHGDHP